VKGSSKQQNLSIVRRRIIGAILLALLANGMKAQEPYFRLKDLSNQWKEYDDLKGEKLTVVDFWATWCHPCVQSIPHLNEMASLYADRGVGFIGVSIDGPRNQSKVAPFIKSMGVTYPILRDINSELMSELNVTAVPTLLIYDSSGELVHIHEGFRPGDELTIGEAIESFLE
jgi:thiol-disulfide isomerase/thioredoxin